MPRLTPSAHYHRYQFLYAAWLHFPQLYALLPLRAQWQVHEFYQPSKELTKDELITHIRQLTKDKPALVHQVGKHVRRMKDVFRFMSKELGIPRSEWDRAISTPIQHYNPSPAHTTTRDGTRYTIAAVARPEVDVRLLARALLELAKQNQGGRLNN